MGVHRRKSLRWVKTCEGDDGWIRLSGSGKALVTLSEEWGRGRNGRISDNRYILGLLQECCIKSNIRGRVLRDYRREWILRFQKRYRIFKIYGDSLVKGGLGRDGEVGHQRERQRISWYISGESPETLTPKETESRYRIREWRKSRTQCTSNNRSERNLWDVFYRVKTVTCGGNKK